jgi:hypothetical protein
VSYDVDFCIDTGGPEPAYVTDGLNHTWNCSSMFCLALGGDGINGLHDKRAGDELPRLRQAVEHISDPANAETYAEMNPSNGWGSHDTATRFLKAILANAEAHPKSTILVS